MFVGGTLRILHYSILKSGTSKCQNYKFDIRKVFFQLILVGSWSCVLFYPFCLIIFFFNSFIFIWLLISALLLFFFLLKKRTLSGELTFYNNLSYFNFARYAPLVLLCAYTFIYILSLLSLHYLCVFNTFIPILLQKNKSKWQTNKTNNGSEQFIYFDFFTLFLQNKCL